jgi:predicted enzyme related to lactoylglutathione lyase
MAQAVGAEDLPKEASPSQDRVALIFSVDDLDASVAKMEPHGVALVATPQDRPGWGIRTAHLRDPDENLIELNVPLAGDQWSEDMAEEAERYSPG